MQHQRGNWSYMQASQELDRIIQSSDPSFTPSTMHSNVNTITPDMSCSICGHVTAHFPIRSSSEVLEHSARRTPQRSSSKSLNLSSMSGGRINLSSVHNSHNAHASRVTTPSSTLTHSTNASRQLRHRLTPHPVAFPTTPLSRASEVTKTPESIIHSEAQSAANSVVSAFRELQAKAKMLESERDSACSVREELRQELIEVRRKHGLSRNKDEVRHNKHLQSIKASTDEQLVGYNYTRNIYQEQKDIEQNQIEKLKSLTGTQTQLAEDIEKLNSKILEAESRLKRMREDLITSRDQSHSIEKVLGSQSIRERADVQREIDTLVAAIKEEKSASARHGIRIDSLSKYMDIILKVNGDLIEAISTRENLDKKISSIAKKQMKKLLRNRENEVNQILSHARDVGVQKAMNVTRNIHLLSDLYLKQATNKHDSSLIEAAARMAATSAANAVVAAKLTKTSSSSCSACDRPKFIPSGDNKNNEFNVVASVSKAAREAKSLNARLASKVKSLDCEGIGALYKDVYRVDLQDMHDQLRAVKKMLL